MEELLKEQLWARNTRTLDIVYDIAREIAKKPERDLMNAYEEVLDFGL